MLHFEDDIFIRLIKFIINNLKINLFFRSWISFGLSISILSKKQQRNSQFLLSDQNLSIYYHEYFTLSTYTYNPDYQQYFGMFLTETNNPTENKQFNYVIIDTDAGADDAQALIVLDYCIKKYKKKLLGITACNGNTGIQNVIKNILLTQKICQSSYPVYSSIDNSIRGQNQTDGYFGKDGLCENQSTYLQKFPITKTLIQKQKAYKFIAKMAEMYRNQIAIICIGPLTNLALAYHYNNQIRNYFTCVSISGSTDTLVGLNYSYTAEFNFAIDPEAAYCIFNTFTNIVLISLEASFLFSIPQTDTIFRNNTTVKAKFIKDLYESKQTPILADPLGVVALFRPDVIKSGMLIKMDIHVKGRRTRGCSTINQLSEQRQKFNCYLIKQFQNKELIQQIEYSYQ